MLARAVVCDTCQNERKITPAEELLGDWQCQGCKSVNYGYPPSLFFFSPLERMRLTLVAHRKACVICNVAKPKERWDET